MDSIHTGVTHRACHSRSISRAPCGRQPVDDCDLHYSRLFDERFEEHSEDALVRLAIEMMGHGGRDNARGTPSGIVYLGQFIGHDITNDGTALLADPLRTPEATCHRRTPLLDLYSVYGDGPIRSAVCAGEEQRYLQPRAGEEKFLLGSTEPAVVNGVAFASTDADLPRRRDNSPVIPDERNDDNLILSQLYVLFLRFHNKLLDLISLPGPVIPAPPGQTPFERTRRLVKWHYQWLVREYFLPMIVLRSVLEDIGSNGPILFKPKSAEGLSLPVEFTMAAFRFGHSMVHERYLINEAVALDAIEILNRDSRRLSAAHVLDWGRFVGLGPTANFGQKINTTISKGLFALSERMITLSKDNLLPATVAMLPARSLLRGSKARLPSGQEACARTPGTTFYPVDVDHRHYSFLETNGLLERLPLWYYLLYEAEVAGVDESISMPNQERGCRLGPLGSRIVAEVLLGLLNVDEDAYCQKGWEPPELPFGNGSWKPITGLRELVEFVA